MLELYENPRKANHRSNNDMFRKLVDEYHFFQWSQPNKELAPWHWQVVVSGEGPYLVLINIWPTSATGQRDGYKSVSGWEKICSVIEQALLENGYGNEDDNYEVIDEDTDG